MQKTTRLKAAFISFSSLGIKLLFPLFLSYFGSDKDFSLLLVTANTLLLSGMFFSLEHHTYYHRKAVQENNIKKIDFYERTYFDQTLLIKIIYLLLILLLLNQFSLYQRILIFFIVYLDLHIVEICRKNEVMGNYLKNTTIWGARMSLPLMLFIGYSSFIKEISLNTLFISTLISGVVIKYLFKIRICNPRNLRFRKNLFLKLTIKTRQFALITILGLFTPLIDKFVLLNFEEYSMIQTISLWSIFGNLISLFILEFINKPYKPKIMNFLNQKDFNKIFKYIIFYQVIIMTCSFIFIFLFRSPLDYFLKPSFNFNLFQIVGCTLIAASIPLTTLFNTTLYGYKRDNNILFFAIFEFLLKYLVTIITIIFLKSFLLPYTLSLATGITLSTKYFYIKRVILRNKKII